MAPGSFASLHGSTDATALTDKCGDSWVWTFRYRTDGDPQKLIDLTGCSARIQVRDPATDAPLLSAGYDPARYPDQGDIQIDWWLGEVRVLFPPALTDAVPPGRYQTDLELFWPGGRVRSTETMTVIAVRDVTEREAPPSITPLVGHFVRQYATGDGMWYFAGTNHAGYTVPYTERVLYLTAFESWYLTAERDGYMYYVPQYDTYCAADGDEYLTTNDLGYDVRRVLP